MKRKQTDRPRIPRFDRHFFTSADLCTRIGTGELGGKATGLLAARGIIQGLDPAPGPDIRISIPRMIVVTTSVFDAFMERNHLEEIAFSDAADQHIARAFQAADLPAECVGDLRALIEGVHTPLAIRSSSLLEDAMHRPFAGVYATKMIPNNQPDADTRFRRLLEAIKLVYASTYFGAAKSYVQATDKTCRDERMAVLIQEVVGHRHDHRYYPSVSGVGKSYNFYPVGPAAPEDGVIHLALGLGKTIVDGGICWVYSPAHPMAPPPFGSSAELLRSSQVEFWAVNMGKPSEHDPLSETEYLSRCTLADAEYDGTLRHIASTYDPESDRLSPGTGRPGARIVNFAPLLKLGLLPLNEILERLLHSCSEALETAIEIEFALALEEAPRLHGHLGFLQVRPMVVSEENIEISAEEWNSAATVLASTRALGNGTEDSILDILYIKPDVFEARLTPQIALQLRDFNRSLLAGRRPYLLIGFGRWGSSDPWLGIPVNWGDISGARVIVEATLSQMNVEASQGAHFFHNISSFRVSYLTVHHEDSPGIDWAWLTSLPAVAETEHVRHVRVPRPLLVKVDGRRARGAVWRQE